MPENDFQPTLKTGLLGAGGAADPATQDEWERIQAAAEAIQQQAQRAPIPSQPDPPEDKTALVQQTVTNQTAMQALAQRWVAPQVTRQYQQNEDVQQALDSLAGEFLEQSQTHTAHRALRKALQRRGMDLRGPVTYDSLLEPALRHAEETFGKMWDKTLDPGRTRKLLSQALLQTISERAQLGRLNKYGPGEWDLVWKVQAPALRSPDLVKGPEDFYNLIQNFQAYRKYVEAEGYTMPQTYRGPDWQRSEVLRLYKATTGAPYHINSRNRQTWHGGIFPTLNALAKGVEQTRRTARTVVPLQLLGVPASFEHVDSQGQIPASVIPLYDKDVATYFSMLQAGYSMTDPESMAEYKTLEEARDKLTMAPGQFLQQLAGKAMPAAAQELDKIRNPSERWHRFFQQINPDTAGPPGRAATRPLGGGYMGIGTMADMAMKSHGYALADEVLNKGTNLSGAWKTWSAARHASWIKRQQETPPELASMLSAAVTDDVVKEMRRQTLSARNKQWDRLRNDPKAFFQKHNLPFRFMTWVANTLGGLDHAIGLGQAQGVITNPLGEFLMDRFFDPLPGDEQLVGAKKIGIDYILTPHNRDIGHFLGSKYWLGYTPNYYWDHMKARHDAGRSNFWDDLAISTWAMRDFFADLPGFTFKNPAGMYLLGKIGGEWGRAINKSAKLLKDSGVPRGMVALAQFAAEPMHPVRALNTMFGVNPRIMRAYRTTTKAFQRAMNEAAQKAPHLLDKERNKVEAYLNLAEQTGLAPAENLAKVRAVYSQAIAKLKRGETLSWGQADNLLEAGTTLPVDLARNILPAPLSVPAALRSPMYGVWEADQVVSQLQNMDTATTNQLKEMTGKTLAEHVGEAWQAWYAQPDLFMPKRKAFYKLLEKLPWNNENKARIKTAYDKVIDIDRNLPAASAQFRDALVALKERRGTFRDDAAMYSAAVEGQKLRSTELARELELKQARLRAVAERMEYLRTDNLDNVLKHEAEVRRSVEQLTGVRPETELTREGLGRIREQLAQTAAGTETQIKALQDQLTARQRIANQLEGAVKDLDLRRNQGIVVASKDVGAEEGYKPAFKGELRQTVVNDTILPVIDAVGRAEATQYGVSRRFVEADRIAEGQAKAAAAKLINQGTMTPAQAQDFVRSRRVDALSKADLWQIPSLSDYYQQVIQAQRALVQRWETAARTDDLRFGIFDVARIDKYPSLKGAHVNEIVQGLHAAAVPYKNMAVQLKRDYWHELTPRDQALLGRILDGDQEAVQSAAAQSHVRSLWGNMEGYRALVLEESYKAGKISQQDYQRYMADAYTERYYPDLVFERELREMGYEPRAGFQHAEGGLPEMQPARFQRFKAQRSAQYARVFYEDRATGTTKEHWESVEQHGSADAANKAAQAWVQDEIKSGRLQAKHFAIFQSGKTPNVLKVMTDKELGGLGVIDNRGMFRVETLERIMRDNLRLRFLNHVAMIGGMVRNTTRVGKRTVPEGVEQQHWNEWTRPLQGKHWGPLQGKSIHRSLIRTINTMDHYGDLLEGVRDQWLEEVQQMKVMTGLDKLMSFRLRQLGNKWPVARFADQLVQGVYHNFIVKNWETWITNHVGNWCSFALVGLNPTNPRTLDAMREFRAIHNAIKNMDITQIHGTAGMWRVLERDFGPDAVQAYRYLHDRNMLAPTVGSEVGRISKLPGKSGGLLNEIMKEHDLRLKKASARLAEVNKSLDLIHAEIRAYEDPEVGRGDVLPKAEYEEAVLRAERLGNLRKLLRAQVGGALTSHPVWNWMKGKPAAYLKEAGAFVGAPGKSVLARYASEEYGMIDAMYKYGAFRRLQQKGLPADQAIADIQDYFQNYNKVPGWVRGLKNMPLLGPMVPSFAYEAARILKNAFTRNPGRAMAVYNFPLIWNVSALAARGMSVNDYITTDSSDNRAQAYTKLWTRLLLPGNDSMMQLYLGKYTYTGIIEHPAGVHRVFGHQMQTKMDQAFGPLPAAVMSGAMNVLSNFWMANPFIDATVEYATGVDSFNREITYGPGVQSNPVKSVGTKLLEMLTPRTFTAAYEELSSSHEESPITGHQRSLLQSAIRLITGMSLTERKDTEAIGLLALRYSNMDELADLYRTMQGSDQVTMREAGVRARKALDAGDEEMYRKDLKVVERMIAKSKDRLIYHSGKWIKLEKTPEEIAETAIRYVSKDIHGAIQRVPIDRTPDYYAEVMLSGYSKAKPELTNHILRQMSDPEFVFRESSPDRLRRAVEKCSSYAQRIKDPVLSSQFDQARAMLQLRLMQLLPKTVPAVEVLLRRAQTIEAQFKDDPVAYRTALQKMLQAEERTMRTLK